MMDLSNPPIWVVVVLWPSLVAVLLLAWLLRRARGSRLSISGFGIKLEITDAPHDTSKIDSTAAT